MCRLFGMTGGREPVSATFWLLDASDSLSEQSHREPDGTGLGAFDEQGRPFVSKQALAAYEDRDFSSEAKHVHSRTFIAHIRYASNGAVAPENTHPFEMSGRLFAHNGVIQQTDKLDEHLGEVYRERVHGETDSERFFALITKGIDEGMAVDESLIAAAQWIAGELPVFALNCILITQSDLWALRYPDTHELHVLERAAGGPTGDAHLEHRATPGEVRVHSEDMADQRSVVVASEPMDDDSGWEAMAPGELLHVDAELTVDRRVLLTEAPAHLLTLDDLDPKAAASQKGHA